jgi:hypothetical protein
VTSPSQGLSSNKREEPGNEVDGNPVFKWKETRKATRGTENNTYGNMWVSRSKNFTKLCTDMKTMMSSERKAKVNNFLGTCMDLSISALG